MNANECKIVDFTAYLYHEMAHAIWWDPGDLTGYAFSREMQFRNKQSELLFKHRKIKCCIDGKEVTEITDAWEDILEACDIGSPTSKKCL